MKKILYDKKVAALITFAVCVLSVLLGGARGLNGKRADVLKIFENGVDNSGGSVAFYADKKATEAHEIEIIAAKHGFSDADKLSKAVADCFSAKTAEEILKTTKELDITAPLVYNNNSEKLNALSELERSYWRTTFNDIESDRYIISGLPYFPIAAEFNRSLDKFPANIIRGVGFVKKLPT